MPSIPNASRVPNAGIQSMAYSSWKRVPDCGGGHRVGEPHDDHQHELGQRHAHRDQLRRGGLAAQGVQRDRSRERKQDQRGQEHVSAVHTNLTASRRRDDEHRAAQHRERVGPDEARLQPSQSARAAAQERGRAVDHSVHPAVVDVDEEPRQPGAGRRDERFVDRVGVQVAPRGLHGPRHVPRPLHRYGPPPDREPRDEHPDRRDDQHERGDRCRRQRALALEQLAQRRCEPVGEPMALGEEEAREDRAERQQHHRHRHDAGRLVRVVGLSVLGRQVLPALLAEERHEHQPGHVERGEPGGDRGEQPERPALPAGRGERRLDDGVLGEVAGQRREADQGEVTQPERDERDRHDAGEAAVVAHVDVVVHGVHDRARPEEQARLEEAVGQQVGDAERVAVRTEPHREEHVADLADRGVGQHLLDVVVGAPDDRADEQGDRADDRDGDLARLRQVVERVHAGDEVDARGDHRCRVDERGDRRGALHRVREPRLQRELAGLAAGAEQQQQRDRDERVRVDSPDVLEHLGVLQRAELRPQDEDRDRQPDVADAVHEERLLGGGGRGRACPGRSRSAGRTRGRRPPSRGRAARSCCPAPAAASR